MIKNYHHLQLTAGTTFLAEIPLDRDEVDLGDGCRHWKFLSVMRSVFDHSIYHQMCVHADRDLNVIHLHLPTKDTCQIQPGKYTFDVISRNNNSGTSIEMINSIAEGIIYVYSSYSLEAYDKARKEIL